MKATSQDKIKILNREDWMCYICSTIIPNVEQGFPFSPSIDHVVPKSKEGTDGKYNLKASHSYCNNSKSNLDLDVFLGSYAYKYMMRIVSE